MNNQYNVTIGTLILVLNGICMNVYLLKYKFLPNCMRKKVFDIVMQPCCQTGMTSKVLTVNHHSSSPSLSTQIQWAATCSHSPCLGSDILTHAVLTELHLHNHC